jgi:hypothetical protein
MYGMPYDTYLLTLLSGSRISSGSSSHPDFKAGCSGGGGGPGGAGGGGGGGVEASILPEIFISELKFLCHFGRKNLVPGCAVIQSRSATLMPDLHAVYCLAKN